MVYRPKVDEKLCFVLMPFGPPYDSYYREIIKPAADEACLATVRSDEIHSRRAIVSDIWQSLWRARLVVADVSNRNPNVNYELGLCDALGVPAIIITGKMEDVPFDYKHRRCILYDRLEAGCDEKLKKALVKTIKAVLAEDSHEDELKWPYDTGALKDPLFSGIPLASADSRKVVIRGANLVRQAIASAYGPHGTSMAISPPFGGTVQAQRGAQIARGIKSLNPLEDRGVEQIRGAASAVYDSVGDFSKLASILAAGFMTKGQELVEQGFRPRDIVESLERSVETIVRSIERSARPVRENDLLAVATTAALSDKRVGALVARAIDRSAKPNPDSRGSNGFRLTVLGIQCHPQLRGGLAQRRHLGPRQTDNSCTEVCIIARSIGASDRHLGSECATGKTLTLDLLNGNTAGGASDTHQRPTYTRSHSFPRAADLSACRTPHHSCERCARPPSTPNSKLSTS